jgi:hypothetical protein
LGATILLEQKALMIERWLESCGDVLKQKERKEYLSASKDQDREATSG